MSRVSINTLLSLRKTNILLSNSCHYSSSKPFPVLNDTIDPNDPSNSKAIETSRAASQELSVLKKVCLAGGGEKGVERHVKINKKILARERIKSILDPGEPLWELCQTAGMGLEYGDVPTAGMVAGVGKIHGVDVMVTANDGSVKAGTLYPISVTKGLRMQDIARQNRLPCLQIVDTGGAFLPLQSDLFLRGGRSFGNQALMSSEGIQQVAVVSGMCTAGGAYAPTMTDVAIITHKIGNIYLGGPPLVKAATGEVVTGEELGGATLHCSVSGITDHFAANEQESFNIARDVIASLNLTPTPSLDNDEPPLYSADGLDIVGGRETIDKADVMAVLARLTDASRFFEFKSLFGGNLVCGFGHICGQMTGILANAGPITAADAQKGGHFVQLCDNRDLPLVFLQNSSLSAGSPVDGAAMKERAKFIQCLSVVRVPKISLNIGGAMSDENYTMCGPSFDPNFYFMWPRSRMSLSDSSDTGDSPTQDAATPKKPKKKLSAFDFAPGSSGWAGGRIVCDAVIEPRDTRDTLARALQIAMFHHVALRSDRGPQRNVVRM